MGRQLAIAMTMTDEREFLAYLSSVGEIRIAESFATSVDALWVDRFSAELDGHWVYYIWNREFHWTPEYGETDKGVGRTSRHTMAYISNASDAPLLEFDRSDVEAGRYGRIYWAKGFSAPSGLNYDVKRFAQWYDLAAGWVRKHAAGKKSQGSAVTWFLSDAWALDKERRGRSRGAA